MIVVLYKRADGQELTVQDRINTGNQFMMEKIIDDLKLELNKRKSQIVNGTLYHFTMIEAETIGDVPKTPSFTYK